MIFLYNILVYFKGYLVTISKALVVSFLYLEAHLILMIQA